MNRKRLGLILVLIAAAAGGWYLWRNKNESDPQAAFALSGNVDVHQVELSFRVAGRIAKLNVGEGAQVKTGELLAQLDDVPFNNDVAAATASMAVAQSQLNKTTHGYRVEEIAQARAAVRQQQANLTNAQVTAKRLNDLFKQGLVTHQQMDDADARVRESEAQHASAQEQLNLVTRGSRSEDIETQQANVAVTQAQLDKAKTALNDTKLYAPSAGVVSVRAREVGAIVQAGQTVFTLILNNPVWIRAYVPQPRLGRIKPGMQVQLEVDSMPGKRYTGTVGFISPEAEFTPKNVQTEQVRDDLVYRIRVIADDPDQVFRQGMPVTVRVPAAADQASNGTS